MHSKRRKIKIHAECEKAHENASLSTFLHPGQIRVQFDSLVCLFQTVRHPEIPNRPL